MYVYKHRVNSNILLSQNNEINDQIKCTYLLIDTIIDSLICTETMEDRSKELRALHSVNASLDRLLRALFNHLFSGQGLPKSSDPPSELLDVISRLRTVIPNDMQGIALNAFGDFRNKWAHNRSDQVNWLLLTQSIQVTMTWFDHLPASNPPSVLETEKDFLQMLGSLCLSYHELYGNKKREEGKKDENELYSNKKKIVEKVMEDTSDLEEIATSSHIPLSFHLNSDMITALSSHLTPCDFVISGVLSELKKTHREDMKGRRVMLLDGKWANQCGTFCNWSGTVCFIKLDINQMKTTISIKRSIGVIRYQ